MPRKLCLNITPEQRRELEGIRDNYENYMRKRAWAILRVADGETGSAVAQELGHRPDTIYRWVHRFQKEGVKGLFIRPGRGRKPKKTSGN